MLEILVYAFGVMLQPGSANILALFAGVNGDRLARFFCTALCRFAMFILFLTDWYLGGGITHNNINRWLAFGWYLHRVSCV